MGSWFILIFCSHRDLMMLRSRSCCLDRLARSSFPRLATTSLRRLSSLPGKNLEDSKPRTTVVLKGLIRENIYTIPNALTLSRILACPFLAWSIVNGNFAVATGLLAYAGVSDWVRKRVSLPQALSSTCFCKQVDGFLARRYRMRSVLGTILDPAADKALMTTLTVTLTLKGMVPGRFCV